MKKLPIGEQSFDELIKNDCLYIDKTKYVYDLIKSNKYYFLSRPRRFGKSLLCSTFEMLFRGRRDLFKNTWIDQSDYDWKEYPVIRFDMSEYNLQSPETLEESLFVGLQQHAEILGVVSPAKNPKDLLVNMLKRIDPSIKVVIFVDEYDKPIINHLTNRPLATKMRETLKNFYGAFKGLGQYMKFLFITGVSKFSKTSIFSDLNHLLDLSQNESAATICGYAQSEIDTYFGEHINHVAVKKGLSVESIKHQMKEMYNGYRFHARQTDLIYNPFSVLNFLSSSEFDNYWFKSGNPKFLFDLMKTKNYPAMNVNAFELIEDEFDKFDVDDMPLGTVLYQTGFLTLAPMYPNLPDIYPLQYPNREVREAFENGLLSYLAGIDAGGTHKIIRMLASSLNNHDLDEFFKLLHSFFASMPYDLRGSNEEVYYQSIFYLICRFLGADVITEEKANIGRIDAVMRTPPRIYIFEFKVNKKPDDAMTQMHAKKYHEKFLLEKKPITQIGINFMAHERNIDVKYLVKEIA